MNDADAHHPYDLEILNVLISINREAGDTNAALGAARRLAEVLPDNVDVKRLLTALEARIAETTPTP